MTPVTDRELQDALVLQPELRRWLAAVPMHTCQTTTAMIVWHLRRVAVLEAQVENLRNELTTQPH